MKLIDVHAHLEHERFEGDLDDVVKRFEDAGGQVIINSGVNPTTNRICLEIAKKYRGVQSSFGLFPIDCIAGDMKLTSEESELRHIEVFDLDGELEWIEENKDLCLAIGEVGLDYAEEEVKIRPELKEKQKENFSKIIDLAKKIDKPLVCHTRKAEADVLDLLEECSANKVVLHCFQGKKALIRRGIELGYSFSVPPVITRLDHFKMLVEMVPLKQLLTETDAPYLSPVAGERNESANVSVTVKEIARIKGLSEEEVADAIFNNAVGLFNL